MNSFILIWVCCLIWWFWIQENKIYNTCASELSIFIQHTETRMIKLWPKLIRPHFFPVKCLVLSRYLPKLLVKNKLQNHPHTHSYPHARTHTSNIQLQYNIFTYSQNSCKLYTYITAALLRDTSLTKKHSCVSVTSWSTSANHSSVKLIISMYLYLLY